MLRLLSFREVLDFIRWSTPKDPKQANTHTEIL